MEMVRINPFGYMDTVLITSEKDINEIIGKDYISIDISDKFRTPETKECRVGIAMLVPSDECGMAINPFTSELGSTGTELCVLCGDGLVSYVDFENSNALIGNFEEMDIRMLISQYFTIGADCDETT